ncbi:cytochrome P450 2H1-like isoform X2 [Spea bombifrons]|uniref:cytochrome P450 2H1-like isoform X2 n=1 Tax=Spea bombifrons TaxID=233779 RepID=UPI00234AC9E5|nr:cytochrome P450 2H1-like isoform X2 [Spea bombifrons]
MDLTTLGISLLVLLISYMLIRSTWDRMHRKQNLPPGPTPLPVIGNLMQIKRGELVKSLMQMAEKYGSVYTLYFGSRPVVVLSGYQTIKEALIDQADNFSGRGQLPTVDRVFQGDGVVLSNGERWKQLRRFTLMTLRNFGMGKRSIEERIQEEAHFLVEELRSQKQSPINPTNILVQAIANVICSVVFGNRFDYEDKSFLELLNMFTETFQKMSSAWGQESKNGVSFFDMKSLVLSVLNLFFAGTETVSTTLRHGLLILVKYPEIQAKLHAEIDRVIGQNRTPNIEDRGKMPYTDAVIHEIQRFSDVIPMNVPHSVIKDTTFRGFTIPKGTDVLPLLCSVLWDPEQFETPNKFNPGHFLDANGCFKKNDAFIPFSIGKRICAGEGLARMELFLFLTNILQNFSVTSQRKFTDTEMNPKMTGFANVPVSYEVSFVPR